MSIATDTKVADLETLALRLVKQMQELNERLTRLESYRKPGPKPKGHMDPQDD